MVVQEDESPAEAPLSKPTKKYVIVKNHVREIMPTSESSSQSVNESEGESKSQKVKNKNTKKRKSKEQASEPLPSDISHSDLEELKTVYKKCAAVLSKIESKYGHLLDLEQGDYSGQSKRKKRSSTDSETECCTCALNKKNVFDENGQQIEKVSELKNHICHKKIKRRHSDTHLPQHQSSNVLIEYDQHNKINEELPDNLQVLRDILKDPNINKAYRRAVIHKVYSIRQGYLFEMRSERQSLIEGLMKNPDELLDFKGTNISSLPGYPKNPI